MLPAPQWCGRQGLASGLPLPLASRLQRGPQPSALTLGVAAACSLVSHAEPRALGVLCPTQSFGQESRRLYPGAWDTCVCVSLSEGSL